MIDVGNDAIYDKRLAKFISQPTTKNVDKMLGQGQKCRNPYFERKCST